MSGINVSMMIDGLPVRKIRHAGRTYLPVRNGDVFTIRVENNTGERVAAIVSVDGRSIMSGELASHSDTGYVVNAYDSVEIKGFRKGLSASKQFVVTTDTGDSYDERRGGSGVNKGVIGVVIKPEKHKAPYYIRKATSGILLADSINRPEYATKTSCAFGPTGSASAIKCCSARTQPVEREVPTSGGIVMPQEGPAGTKMGDLQTDRVREVAFEEDDSRKSVITLYYDTVEGLKNKGVPIEYLHPLTPDPFPAEPRTACYCPDA